MSTEAQAVPTPPLDATTRGLGWLLLGLQGRDAVRERLYKDQHAVGEHALISQLAAQLRDRGV